MAQLQLIMALLEGYDDKVHHLKDGTTIRYLKDTGKVRYFEDGSPDDRRARMALADMLWDEDEQIPAEVRYALAKLFEPRFGRGRKLKFTRGRRKNVDLELAATRFIYRAVKRGATVNEAMKSAEDYFGLGRENIRKIWKTHKPFEVRLHGALPPARRGRKKK